MLKRTLLSILLILSLMTAGAARAPFAQDENPDGASEEKLTPEEESEARALAEDFIKRLEQEEDIAPLFKEFYVGDFATRLRSHPDQLFLLTVESATAAQMSDDELLRAYAASTDTFYLGLRLYLAAAKKREQERLRRGATVKEEGEDEPTLEEIIPHALMELIRSDAALSALLDQELKSQQPESDQETEKTESLEDLLPFNNPEQARHYTRLANQGAQLIREYLKSLPPEQRPTVKDYWTELSKKSNENDAAGETQGTISMRLLITKEEEMDYPIGTRLICINILMFHLDLVPAPDGRLRVVSFGLMSD